MKKILSLSLLSLVGVMSFVVAHAKSDLNVALSPSVKNELMSYEVKPGGTFQDSFSIENVGTKSGKFEVYVVDLDDSKKVEKDYTPPKLQTETQTGIGLWTALSERYVTLDPGQKRVITFFVTVPPDAEKEKLYRGAIIAKALPVVVKKKAKAIDSDMAGGNIAITSQVSVNLSVKVTDNPVSFVSGAVEPESDGNLPYPGMKAISLVVVVVFIIFIGYFFYRKK